jgi:hypothetical protein
MRGVPRAFVRSRLARLILGALAVAIFTLSLQDDWDIEITLSQPSHSFVAKVGKDSKENPGGDKPILLAATALVAAPSSAAYIVAVADPHRFPTLVLLRSISVRAPPVA